MNKLPFEWRHLCRCHNLPWCNTHHIPRYRYPKNCDKTIEDFRREFEDD